MDLIKTLNSISVDDIKNIDWGSVKDRLLSKPGLMINIFLIVVTVIIVFTSISKQAITTNDFKSQISGMKLKIDALDKYKIVQKAYKEKTDNIPESISTDQLIETLSDFAIKWNVQILSFSPAKEKSNNFADITNVKINISSEEYANILLFMYDIENSPYMIRVGKLSGSYVEKVINAPRSRNRRGLFMAQQNQSDAKIEKSIEATVEIESVKFKYG